jgi:hypothetical protein
VIRGWRRAVLATALLATLVSGCTSVSSGDPRPAESATSAPPARPREIKLDSVAPCILLPQADYPTFELNKPGKPGKTDRGAPDCLWQGDIGYMSATLVTFEGVDAQVGRYGKFEPIDPIDDFPAYTITLPDDDQVCFVMVDIADGQYIKIQVGLNSRPEDRPICDYARQFTESVMGTLVKQ